ILTVRLGDLADAYLARVRALEALPAEEVSAFLALASRLVLLKARSLLPSLEPLPVEEGETEEELRARLLEYAVVRERAGALGDRLRAGERAFHREGGTVELPPRGGEIEALASAFSRVLARVAGATPRGVETALAELGASYEGTGLRLQNAGDQWQIVTAPDHAPQVAAYLGADRLRLSPASLETLAVVAYRQPVTRAEV